MYQMMENEKECEEHKMVEKTMDKIVALAKSRGFVYPGSEIHLWFQIQAFHRL